MDAETGKEDGDLLPSSGMVVSPAANLANSETDTGVERSQGWGFWQMAQRQPHF